MSEIVKKQSAFSSLSNFDDAQRMAKALTASTLVPKPYQNNISNTLVALEMANRINISPLMVMQNLDIIQGKPSWRSSFIISALNSCGRFKPLRFKFEGQKGTDEFGCRAYTYDLETNELVEGVKIDWKMVKAEGWLSKGGSKWKTMPELMFQYRAASFFGRLYAPDILTGMHSVDEIIDVNQSNVKDNIHDIKLEELNELYYNQDNNFMLSEEEALNIERIIDQKEVLSYDKAIKYLNSKLNG